MRSAQSCQAIAKGILIGLASEGVSPPDRVRILTIALRGAQTLAARIQRRNSSNGAKSPD
jgi:hypothetical protein